MTSDNGAAAAAAAIQASIAEAQVTTGGGPGAELPETRFPRLSFERRVLGHITDLVDESAFGPRNTLAALTRALMRDPGSTNPPTTEHGRLETDGKTLQEIAQSVLDTLNRLVDAELVSQHKDGSYAVTKAGVAELGS